MKKLKLILGILLLLFGSYAISSNVIFKTTFNNEISSGDKYRVTAQTRNPYGQNYWIDLIVEGYVGPSGNSITAVYYNDGYGLKSVSYGIDYEYENSYYVMIDYKTYYFTF